jgi:IclR family acetate operon transcriptional repressor
VENEEKGFDGVRAVDRALAILLAFSPSDDELSAVEIARRVGLSRPTLYRLLYTLERQGFVVSVGEPQRFRLGGAIARLAHAWTCTLDVSRVARGVLRSVWDTTGETVALFVRQGNLRLCVAEMPSVQPLSFKRGVGYSEAIVLGASGRAILAFSNLGDTELGQLTRASGVDPARLKDELASIRERGFAYSRSELIQGAVAVAAPFFDRTGEVAGSLGVFGPEVRIDVPKVDGFGHLLVDQGLNLSRDLGFVTPAAASEPASSKSVSKPAAKPLSKRARV